MVEVCSTFGINSLHTNLFFLRTQISNLWFYKDSNTQDQEEDVFEDSLSELPEETTKKEESGDVKEGEAEEAKEELGISDGVFISEQQGEQTASNMEEKQSFDIGEGMEETTEIGVSGSLMVLEDFQPLEGKEFDNAEEEIREVEKEENREEKSKEEINGEEAVVKERSIFRRMAPVSKMSLPAKLSSSTIEPIKLPSSANQPPKSSKSTRPNPMRRRRRLRSFGSLNTILLPSEEPAETAKKKSPFKSASFAQMDKKKSPNKVVSFAEVYKVDKVQTRHQEQLAIKEVQKGRSKVPQLGLISGRAGRGKRGLDVQGQQVKKTKKAKIVE